MKTRVLLFITAWLALLTTLATGQQLTLPNREGSFRFAVIGDSGTGGTAQRRVADQMVEMRKRFPFDVVVMAGDNMYGREAASDFRKKFEIPYAKLLEDGVKFYAALGNHDNPNQRNYKNFNMGGKRFYSFQPRDGIRFFALDTTYMNREQVEWIEKELKGSDSQWKIVFFHHPLYSSGGRHGSDRELRAVLEPLFLRYGVSLVLAGHDHFYERIKPQHGLTHFVVGSSAKLRKGNIRKTDLTAKGFDTDHAFLLCEIDGDVLHFQAISKVGQTVDSGTIARPAQPTATESAVGLTVTAGAQ